MRTLHSREHEDRVACESTAEPTEASKDGRFASRHATCSTSAVVAEEDPTVETFLANPDSMASSPISVPLGQSRLHLQIVEFLQRVAPASASFSCIAYEGARAYSFLRYDHASDRFEARDWMPSLDQLVPIDWERLGSDARRTFLLSELGVSPSADGRGQILLLALRSASRPLGLFGLQRSGREPGFSQAEQQAIEALAGAVSLAAGHWLAAQSLVCENAALRALGTGDGALMIADADATTILWAARPVDPEQDLAAVTRVALDAVQRRRASDGNESRFEIDLHVVTTAEVDVPELDARRCVAVRLASEAAEESSSSLSQREAEVAKLLMNGYANVNIAAIMGLSENTIRTYVRRLYRKLGVCNRIELMHAMYRAA